jgi:ubiquitin carboxyl-terminal hydrolase 8
MKDFKEYENKGLTGLANVGNTCYLNSFVQILSHTYELTELLEKKEYKKKLNQKPDSVILLEFDKLRELMWSSNCTVAPNGFVNAIKKVASFKKRDIFTGYDQNDLQEFLLFMFECFHNALARVVDMNITGSSQNETDELAKTCFNMLKQTYNKEYSEMLSLFHGTHVSEISEIETGKSLSLRPEPFSVISLSVPSLSTSQQKNITIFDCMDLYCKKEKLDGENKWFNEKTNEKQEANRGIIFWSLPEILIIDLKRWNGYTKKLNTLIETPLTDVDFSTYVKGYNSKSYIYDLYGVCNHSGGVSGGHYTSYVKNANGKWYEFNDTRVNEIAESSVISQKSYCFFYRKK